MRVSRSTGDRRPAVKFTRDQKGATLNDCSDVRKAIEALFSGQRLAVLSTCSSDGHPYASLVCVVAEADLSGIYFATSRATRKFANLTAEPRA